MTLGGLLPADFNYIKEGYSESSELSYWNICSFSMNSIKNDKKIQSSIEKTGLNCSLFSASN